MSRLLQVSDHALLRFMERGADIDVEALRDNLRLSLQHLHDAATSIAAREYLIKADGLLFVVRGDVVTTTLASKDVRSAFAAITQRRV